MFHDEENEMFSKIAAIVGGVFLVIAIAAAIGLGIWGYQLNTNLTATQKQLASLQSDYNKLKADDTKVTANLSQTSSTLDQTKSDLAKAQSDLAKANSDKNGQRAKMDAARSFVNVLEALVVNSENQTGVEAKIIETGDSQLINLWSTVKKSTTTANVSAFNDYLIETILSDLK
jgi:hypothetical protein